MAISIGDLIAHIGADFSDMERALSAADTKLKDVGKKLTSAGKTMSAAVTLPLTAIGVASVKMASDAEEAANKFDVVMGPAAARIREELQKLHGIIPETQGDLEGMAAGIQDMLVPFGVAREEAAGMSLDMVRLAGDIASFNNVLPTEALAAMKSALAGSSEPMLRFGVDTRVASLEAIALANGLMQEGEELTNTARSQAVLIAIQQQSTDAMGDAERTVDSTANTMKFFARDVKELSITIGQILIPIVVPLIQRAKELMGRFQELSPEMQKAIVAGGALAAVVGPLMVAIGLLLTPVGAVAVAIGALGAAWILWGDDVSRIVTDTVKAVDKWLGDKFDKIAKGVGKTVDGVVGFFEDARDLIRDILVRIVSIFGDFGTAVLGAVGQTVSGIRNWFVDKFQSLIVGPLARILEGVGNMFGKVYTFITGKTSDALGAIKSQFTRLGGDAMVGPTNVSASMVEARMALMASEAGASARAMSAEYRKAVEGMIDATNNMLVPNIKVAATAMDDYLTPAAKAASEAAKKVKSDFEALGGSLEKVPVPAKKASEALDRGGFLGVLDKVSAAISPDGGDGVLASLDALVNGMTGPGGVLGEVGRVIERFTGSQGIVGALGTFASSLSSEGLIGGLKQFVLELVKEKGILWALEEAWKIIQKIGRGVQGVYMGGAGGTGPPGTGPFGVPSGLGGRFASGGFHSGGLRLVGERGPELEFTGPSRIMSSRQSMEALGGNGALMQEQLEALRADVRVNQAAAMAQEKRDAAILQELAGLRRAVQMAGA